MIILDLGGYYATRNGERLPRYLVIAERRYHINGVPTETTHPVVIDSSTNDYVKTQYPQATVVRMSDLEER